MKALAHELDPLRRATIVGAIVVMLVPLGGLACGKSDECSAGTTQVCNDSDGSNCVCAPDCQVQSDCQRYTYTRDGVSFMKGVGLDCDPTAHACLPTRWIAGSVIDVSSAPPAERR